MGKLRAAGRLLAIGAVTGFYYALVTFGGLAGRLRTELGLRCRDFCLRNWSRALLRLMGARVSVRGAPPSPPFMLVSNHLSYVDVLVLASRVSPVFLAKSEVAGWPLVGALCRSVGTLFVDRRNRRDLPRVLAAIDRALERGQGVVVFPEGTSTSGEGVEPFYPPLLEVAARRPFPVSYATLSYSTPPGESPAREAVCWWGDLPFAEHMWRVLRVRRIHATLAFGAESVTAGDRKELAVRLQQSVAEQYPGHAVAPPAPRAVAGRAGTR